MRDEGLFQEIQRTEHITTVLILFSKQCDDVCIKATLGRLLRDGVERMIMGFSERIHTIFT